MSRNAISFFSFLVFLLSADSTLCQVMPVSVRSKSPCEIEASCTSDPTYKFFEKQQLKAYCGTELGRRRLDHLTDTALNNRIFREVDSSLDHRPNSLNLKDRSFSNNNRIISGLNKLKLPTCYEDPRLYYLINDYMTKVERARKQLGLPLKMIPKYGSLPTSEINAYTYPPITDEDAVEKRGSVIGFNTQLFMFAYQMPKITFPTISVIDDKKAGKIGIDYSKQTAIKAIETNPDLKVNFSMAILEFLQLAEPETRPLDSKYDIDLINFTLAIELFAVAHEYGHLIKGHTLQGTKSLRLNSSTAEEAPVTVVGIRSWQQELEADEVGIRLLFQVIQNEISDQKDILYKQSAQVRQVFRLYAPLFYFKCSDIIERATAIRDSGKVYSEPSTDEKAYMRALAEGKATGEQKARYAGMQLSSHPPAWIRLEKASRTIQQQMSKQTYVKGAIEYSEIAKGLIQNIDILWGVCLPRFPTLLNVLMTKKAPDKIGYAISPAVWDLTFLYNPELQNAVSSFNQDGVPDSILIAKYWDAVRTDWLLLSGLQVRWAKKILASNDTTNRGTALAVAALSGDDEMISYLKQVNASNWNTDHQELLQKALAFLDRNSRNTTSEVLQKTIGDQFELKDLLCYPANGKTIGSIDSLIPQHVPTEIQRFIRSNQGISLKGSYSCMALYMLAAHTTAAMSYGFWTDVLLKDSNFDKALEYARAGLAKVGPNANLENDIGNILSAKGNLRGGNEHYEASLRLGRVDGWPELNMAKNYSDLNELAKAEEWFEKAIHRDSTARDVSEYAGYLNEYAWFLATHFQKDSVRCQKALVYSYLCNKLTSYVDPNFLDTLAECLALNGDPESAIKVSGEALKLIPPDSSERGKYEARLKRFKSTKQGK